MDGLLLLTFLSGVLLWSHCSAAVSTPTLTMKLKTGLSLANGADVLFGEKIVFRCGFDQLAYSGSGVVAYKAKLRTQEPGGSFVDEAGCQFVFTGTQPSTKPEAYIESGNNLKLKQSDITCGENNDFALFGITLLLSKRVAYECVLERVLGESEKANSDPVTLKSHSKPTEPVITQNPPAPKAGDTVTFSCTSLAYPAPKLDLKYRGISRVESSGASIPTNEKLIEQTAVNWTVVVDGAYHNKELKCEVGSSHPYKQYISKTKRLSIIYGPKADQPNGNIKINLNDIPSPVVACTMSGYPEPTYQWKKGGEPIVSGSKLTIPTKDYPKESQLSNTVEYECVGTNSNTSKTATKIFIVELTNEKVVPTKAGSEEGTTMKQGLVEWQIAVIVIAVVVIVVIVTAIIICVVRRRNNSNSVKKSKAAQARRSSSDDDKTDASRFQSTASFGLQDMNNRPGNYSENPTLPIEHRYGANVEQYAEAIDDRPRSRKPIALDDMKMFDDNSGLPAYGEAPPAYTDMNPYRMEHNYSTYSPSYHGSTYGAAC